MKNNNYLIILAAFFASLLLLSGCSDNTSEYKDNVIAVNVSCSGDYSSYITLESGDIVEKANEDASYMIIHFVDGTKKICITTPTVNIIR